MPYKTRTGKKFILVAKSVVGKTTGTFPDKTVTISGKGELSGKEFSTDITIKAGQPKRILNGFLFNVDGTITAPPPPPLTYDDTSSAEYPTAGFTWKPGN